MKRVAILVLIITLLVLGGAALAQPGDSESHSPYLIEPGTASGGHYQLSGQGISTTAAMSGGAYYLRGSVQASAVGNGGCCCTYIPCLLRQ